MDEQGQDSNPNLVRTISGYQELVKWETEHVHAVMYTLPILYDTYCLMLLNVPGPHRLAAL